MKNKIIRFIFFISAIMLVTTSCSLKSQKKNVIEKAQTIKNAYAKGFSITNAKDYTIVTVYSPWKKGEIYAKYYLVKDSLQKVPQDGTRVLIPIKKLVANSATYFEPLSELNSLNIIKGTCSSKFIYSPYILNDVKTGKIKDLGDAFNLNIEQTLSLKPEAVMTTTYNSEDANVKRFKQTGIAILFNFEWMEDSPLGRAEWIKFIAAFVDKQSVANKLFDQVKNNYQNAKSLVVDIKDQPTVMVGEDFRGSWSMPGGHSFNAQLIKDAKGKYFYENDTTTGSINSSIEDALVKFSTAQIWISTEENTLKDLQSKNPQYTLFNAFKSKQVYNWNNRMNSSGGNDYWESAVSRPDIVLKDLIKTFHPNLLPGYKPTYLKKLQ